MLNFPARLMCLFGFLALTTGLLSASDESEEKEAGFAFTTVVRVPCTPVKNQSQTGTCWSFATSSFLEAEALRMGQSTVDISEMFVVRHIYPQKARSYVRWHGKRTLGPGSLSGDALRVLNDVGVVPEEVYSGKFAGRSRHDHREMDAVLKAMLDVVVSNRGNELSPAWPDAVNAVLDAYLGPAPGEFEFEGKTYTPRSFATSLGLDADAYVHLTSYVHHPFYQPCIVEVPDNWANNRYWNVPLNELMHVMDHALELGFTIAWDGDVSEKSFLHKKGVAFLPKVAWEDRDSDAQDAIGDAPEEERVVTQQTRQADFEQYRSTDDHLMHVVGIAQDQNGTRYYVTKNSWGELNSEFDGYVHISEAYARSKTISITLHRDALTDTMREKLGLQDE